MTPCNYYYLFYSILAHLQRQKILRVSQGKNFNRQPLTFHKVSEATHFMETVSSECETSMPSSRMRTACLLTVSRSI